MGKKTVIIPKASNLILGEIIKYDELSKYLLELLQSYINYFFINYLKWEMLHWAKSICGGREKLNCILIYDNWHVVSWQCAQTCCAHVWAVRTPLARWLRPPLLTSQLQCPWSLTGRAGCFGRVVHALGFWKLVFLSWEREKGIYQCIILYSLMEYSIITMFQYVSALPYSAL